MYWVGPCLGAIIAAGFYKSAFPFFFFSAPSTHFSLRTVLKWLQYETNLGPEDEANTNNPSQLATPGATMIPVSQINEKKPALGGRQPTLGGRQPSTQTGMDVVGPGLGDLLTASDGPRNGQSDMVYGLQKQQEFPVAEYSDRLERIEAMLAQLVMVREGNQTQGMYRQVGGYERNSVEGTVVEEPQGHAWKRDSPV